MSLLKNKTNLHGLVKNNKGQTVAEALVGFGLVTLIGASFVGGIMSLGKTSAYTQSLSETDKQIKSIIENVKAGVESYQLNFDYNTTADSSLGVTSLPMAWDFGVYASAADCPKCAGRYGFVVKPMDEYRGLFIVTLRMTHSTWIARGENYRDYNFVVSVK